MKRKTPTELNRHIKDVPDMQKLLHKRRKLRRIIKIIAGVVFVSICIAGLFFLHSSRTQIYSITVSGNQITDTSEIVKEVQGTLSGTYAYIIPKTSIFFYPKNLIYANIARDFPRFDSVHVSLVDKTTLLIEVTEERGRALWCGEDSLTPDMTAPCYFTDANGKIIDNAPYYSGNVYMRFFGHDTSFDMSHPLGQNFINATSYQMILAFAEEIQSLGFSIQAIRLGTTGTDYFILTENSQTPAYISFKDGDSYDTLFANLKTALGKTELADQLGKNKENLQYFDLRFTNKVYYKFNDTATSTKKHAN